MKLLELMGFGAEKPTKRGGIVRQAARASAATVRMLKAFSYEASEPGGVNDSHWSAAGSISARQANSLPVRQSLRNRSRYETANNSIMHGICHTYAADLIGDGPRLQVLAGTTTGVSRKDAQQLERVWNSWADAVDLWGKIELAVLAQTIDGEAFAVFTTNPRIDHPVKLDLQLVECDRVTNPRATDLDVLEVDGIKFDEKGNPITYRVLKHHPDDQHLADLQEQNEADFFSADEVMHYFARDRVGQVRGIPTLTPSLDACAQLRRWNISVLTASENAADNSSTIETNNPIDPEDESIEAPLPFDEIPMSPGMATVLPDGYTRKNLKPEFPTTTHAEFTRSQVSIIARPLAMPVNIAMADSSQHNFASGKLDHGTYFHKLTGDRRALRNAILDRIVRAFVLEASLNEGLIPEVFRRAEPAIRFGWMWPVRQHADPAKEATALEKRLSSGATNLMIECANIGLDWQDVLEGEAEIQRFRKELGIEPPSKAPASSSPKPNDQDKREDDQGDDDE